MIKALLVDDEPLILRGLKKIINWNEFDICIVGEADNGDKALQLLEECKPDILISDICMPDINGIDIIRTIKEKELHTKVIFISGYQEFSYAKNAVAYGAVDYLLKPIDKIQLEQAVDKAVRIVNEEKKKNKMQKQLSQYKKEHEIIKLDKMLCSWVHGKKAVEEIVGLLHSIGLKPSHMSYAVFVIGLKEEDIIRFKSEHEIQLLKFSLFNSMESELKRMDAGVIFKDSNYFTTICYLKKNGVFKDFETLAGNISDKMNKAFGLKVTIAVGKSVSSLEDIPDSYAGAVKCIKHRYFLDHNIIVEKMLEVQPMYDIEYLQEESNVLISKLTAIQSEKDILLQAKKVLEIMYYLSFGNREAVISQAFSLISEIHRKLSEIGIVIDGVNNNQNYFLKYIDSASTFNQLEKLILEYVKSIVMLVGVELRNKEYQEIKKVKEYVRKNYHKNITLEDAASIACMNHFYFSAFFKKHTGVNFKDYVTKVKMEESMKILMNTNCKTYEIAEQVGYNNPRHFSSMFKKYYGKHPMDYKKSLEKI